MPAIHGGVGRDGRVFGRRTRSVLGRALRALVHGLDGLYAADRGLSRECRALHVGVAGGVVAHVVIGAVAPFDWGCRQPTFHFGKSGGQRVL